MMLKAQYDHRGPVPQEVIRAVPLELPSPEAGQALVAMVASPINPSNLLTLTGEYGVLPPLPAIGGSEGVGRVVALGGGGIEGLSVGQLVLLPRGSGTWVTHLLADARALVPLPEGADPLQLARHRGLRTVSLVRRASAIQSTKTQGGDVVLVDGEDIAGRVREATAGAAIRLGIDAIGGAATDRLAQCLADDGTLHARVHATYPVAQIQQAVAAAGAAERDGKILVTGV